MDPDASLTIVVVAFESAGILGVCLDHAKRAGARQILVIDNASRDGSADVARAAGADFHVLDSNIGFARACNIASGLATGDLLCFLNPDCMLDRTAVVAACRALGEHGMACAVPDFLMDGTRQPGRQPGYTRLKLLCDILDATRTLSRLSPILRRLPGHHDHAWHWPLGTCLFVKTSVFNGLGGFDERYFVYMEDVDFGRRLCASGGAVIALDHCLVHEGSMGSNVSPLARRKLLDGARLAYAEAAHGKAFASFLRAVSRA